MKLQQAIKIMTKAGYTFIGRRKEEDYGNWTEYTFRTPEGHIREFMLADLRRRARREDENLWLKEIRAKYAFGVQDELFDTEDYLAC